MEPRACCFLLAIIFLVVIISGCSSTSGNSISSGKKFVMDDTYYANARVSSEKAVEYCDEHPYGIFKDVIYNGDGIGVPITVDCGGACIETGTCK